MAITVGLTDGKSVGVLYMVKLYRIMMFWVLLYVMDKVYQTKYVEDVYVAHNEPPSLLYMPLYLVAVESVSFMLVFVVLLFIERRFRNTSNTFIIDDLLLSQVMADYVMTTLVIVLMATAIVSVVCSSGLLRYGHDGMRGIRASFRIIFYVVVTVLMIPLFFVY